jgi:hypothetical protein
MFVVFANDGPRKIRGFSCHMWRGIPSLAEVMQRVKLSEVTGMQIEVAGLRLPDSRVNTYAKSLGTFGSYDGQTLTVSHLLSSGTDTRDPELRRSVLRLAYNSVCRLYFDIFHGLAEGERKTAPDPAASETKQ